MRWFPIFLTVVLTAVVCALATPFVLEQAGYRLQVTSEATDAVVDFTTHDVAALADAPSDVPTESVDGVETGDENEPVARNVILLIGDGMGFSQLAGARYATVGANGRLTLDRFPITGWSFTHSAEQLYTDSAAGATALATGHKTVPGALSVDPDGQPLTTIAELATAAGKSVGLVTDSYVFDATPSAFVVHRESRRDLPGILDDLGSAAVQVLIGETRDHLEADAAWPSAADRFEERGVVLGRSLDELGDAPDEAPLLGLFAEGSIGDAAAEPSLNELAELALRRLSADPDGFFLMVETEETDTYSHHNQIERTLAGVAELDRVAQTMVDFARADGETLVLVTADHDTGGLALLGGRAGEPMRIRWATNGHTAEPVPVLAYGAGAEHFVGALDNTEVGRRLQQVAGLVASGE